MLWAIVSSWSCFSWLYTASPSLAAMNVISLISALTICWVPCVESSLVLLEEKRVFVMTSAFSWQNCVSLCPASFYSPRPNFPVTPGISWLSPFALESPMRKRTCVCVCVCVIFLSSSNIQIPLEAASCPFFYKWSILSFSFYISWTFL